MKYNKAVIGGHFVISFDNVINGFLAVVMAPLFFGSSNDPIVQLLSSYAAYAALFVTGPVGALTFGRMGDKFGRKNALLVSIMGIGLPVFAIGILPTYSTIGVAAPIILIILRMLQGFFKGAEYSGVLIHNHETGNKRVSSSANVISLGCFGGCAAAVVCWCATQSEYVNWSWRIPFTIGGMLAFVVFFFRMRIPETDDYIEILNQQRVSRSPIKELVSHHKLETLVGIVICAMYMAFAYSSMIFGNRLFQQAGYSVSQSMLFSVFDMLWISISISICGKVADKIGMVRQMQIGSLVLMAASYPLCMLIDGELTLFKIYTYMIFVTFLSASIASCSAAYVLHLLPAHCRYTGFALSDSLGAIIGGATPLMMLLFSSIFKTNLGCALWFYIMTIPTFVLITLMNRRIKDKSIQPEIKGKNTVDMG
ncbi:MAG: MFS transporter [Holosporales bacterium]|jgi:MHS family proline/betaine transporter-like MFS transporter|nr:MFS transporter [Holosporales bacterium]